MKLSFEGRMDPGTRTPFIAVDDASKCENYSHTIKNMPSANTDSHRHPTPNDNDHEIAPKIIIESMAALVLGRQSVTKASLRRIYGRHYTCRL